jgi:hypothetical protein
VTVRGGSAGGREDPLASITPLELLLEGLLRHPGQADGAVSLGGLRGRGFPSQSVSLTLESSASTMATAALGWLFLPFPADSSQIAMLVNAEII